MKLIKRNGQEQDFDLSKIRRVINLANKEVPVNSQVTNIEEIVSYVSALIGEVNYTTVEAVQDKVEEALMHYNYYDVAKHYIIYRETKKNKKKFTEDEEKIISICNGTSDQVKGDNSNKDPRRVSTQRDYIAGTMCKTLGRKVLPKDIVEAHDKAQIHFHDMDYSPVLRMSNCCLVNFKDMLENGFNLNNTHIDTPKSFRTACNLACQIFLHVSQQQYGGMTGSWAHLAKYVQASREKISRNFSMVEDETLRNQLIDSSLRNEIKEGVQTFQYQIITLSGASQTPFSSMSMNFDECESEQHEKDLAMVIEEVLNQRISGFTDSHGLNVSPIFPKLLYFLDECNAEEGSKYFYLTELAAKCVSKRMAPDFISSKVQREIKGIEHTYPCMGCRSFLTTEGSYMDNGVEKKCSETFYGRHNNGVVTINLPYVALESEKNMEKFWEILDDRLELCYRALVERYKALKGTKASAAPILWMEGALARKKADDTIDDLITGFRCTYSLGYVGLWETVYYMTGKTLLDNREFALSILKFFQEKHKEWHTRLMDSNNPNSFLNTSSYGTPEENFTDRAARALQSKFGIIEGVTDHDYVTNSYHINPSYKIDAFSKLQFESEFQNLSTGGAISYVELPNMSNNIGALLDVIHYMYENVLYSECNLRIDKCTCGYEGEINLLRDENGKYYWQCPNCKTTEPSRMSILRRVCGYIGNVETGMSNGRLSDISNRVLHL